MSLIIANANINGAKKALSTPSVPTNLAITVTSDTVLTLTWESAFTTEWWRSTIEGGTYTLIATVDKGTLTYADGSETPLTAGTEYFYKARGKNGSKYSAFTAVIGEWTNPDFVYSPVVEDVTRVANRSYSFTGATRTVGTDKTYATITAAYTAASAGDIIEVYNSLDMKDEASGYLLLNTAAKRILIRGMGATPSDVVLSQSGASNFYVKLATVEVVFENIKITSAKSNASVYNDTDGDNSIIVFNNCVLETTYDGAAGCYNYNDSYPDRNRWIEFKNCTITKTLGTGVPINITSIKATCTLLVTGCTITSEKYSCFRFLGAGYTGGINIYDSVLATNANYIIIQLGTDATTADQTFAGLIDIRGCTMNFGALNYNHAVLFGGDTAKLYFVNNKINTNAIDQAANLGLVIKTVSTSLANAVVKGNRISAPYPIFLKGSAYIDVQNNILIQILNEPAGIKLTNTDETVDRLIDHCTIKYNTIYSPDDIYSLETVGLTDIKTCALTGDINNNIYCTNTGKYINKDTTDVEWADKSTFWGNDFDDESIYKTGLPQPS